jgi:TPR repeat protein
MGCNNLGAHHDEAQGVPRDVARAAGYYRQACDGGIGLACANLARLAESEGLGDADPAALRARACELGQSDACP